MAYWCGLEFVQSSHGLVVWFTSFSDVVCSSHSLEGLSRIHIVQWSGLEYYIVYSDVHIGLSGACPEFTWLTGVVWSVHYSVMWYVVHIA